MALPDDLRQALKGMESQLTTPDDELKRQLFGVMAATVGATIDLVPNMVPGYIEDLDEGRTSIPNIALNCDDALLMEMVASSVRHAMLMMGLMLVRNRARAEGN